MKNIQKIVGFLFLLVILFMPKAQALAVSSVYSFDTPDTLPEAGSMSLSASSYWWVNSGAYLKAANGRGSTVKDSLPANDPWRILYAKNNPTDTDQGLHPQNIFRLLSRSKWKDAREEVYFVIAKDNLSDSSNRNQSNGLLLLNRYQDGSNLYYAGVRVDGSAVIKKKKGGSYYTLSQVKGIYPGTYNRTSSPNLLPKNKWIGLRTEVKNLVDGKVEIKLYLDKVWSGNWVLVASAIDDGVKYGGSAFTQDGFTGIRTDFMDVEFENFRVRDL